MHIFVCGHHPLRLDILPFLVKALEDGEKGYETRPLFGGYLRGLVSRVQVDGVGLLPELFLVRFGGVIQEAGREFRACVDERHSCFLL